jgi:hypothetical protein
MVRGQRRRSVELAFLLMSCMPACDQSPDEDPPQGGVSLSQPSPSSTSTSGPTIELVINQSPRVTSMSSSTGLVTVGESVQLQAVASDLDGDRLTLRWTATCPGTFDHDDTTPAIFVPGVVPADSGTCTFEITVDDGRGGNATGMLTLSTVPPRIEVTGGE